MTAKITLSDRDGKPIKVATETMADPAGGPDLHMLKVSTAGITVDASGVTFDTTGLATEAKQDAILAAIADLAAKVPTPTQRTATASTTSTSGTVPLGAKAVSFVNTGAATGSVLGVPLLAGGSISLSVDGGDTLEALEYDATGTTFLISVTR